MTNCREIKNSLLFIKEFFPYKYKSHLHCEQKTRSISDPDIITLSHASLYRQIQNGNSCSKNRKHSKLELYKNCITLLSLFVGKNS